MAYKRNYKRGGLRKRWYVNAEATLPFIGKTKINMGNQKFKRAVQQIVKRSVIAPRLDNFTTVTNNMLHSTLYTYNVTAQIDQGSLQQARQGDTIYLKYVKANLKTVIDFSTLPTNVLNCHYRVMILKSSKEFNPSSSSFGSGLGATEVFLNSTNPDLSFPDTREVKVLFDRTYNYTTEAATDIGVKTYHNSVTVPLNETFRYRDSGGDYGKAYNLYMLVIPFCPQGVVGTTTIGSQTIEGIIGFAVSQ